jgi:hypothetical protein
VTHESRHWLQIPRLSAGVFLLVGPVVVVGVDVVAGDELVAGCADDGDGVGGDQHEYGGVGVGAADADVVEAAGVAQGEFAELVTELPQFCSYSVARAGVGWLAGCEAQHPSRGLRRAFKHLTPNPIGGLASFIRLS